MLRVRLLEVLESPLPVVFIEAVPGSGKQVLLDQWAKLPLGPSADIRLLIDGSRVSASGPAMLRLIWSRLRTELDIAELPLSDEDLLVAARRLLDRTRRPVSIALLRAEEIPAATFSYLLGLLEAATEVRLTVWGTELTEHVQLARTRGVSFSLLDDVAMALTLDETRTLLNEMGMKLAPEVVGEIHRDTRGHMGLVRSSVADLPAGGTWTPLVAQRALASFAARLPDQTMAVGFGLFISRLVRVPRFSVREARVISQLGSAAHLVHRLQALGLGVMTWHSGLGQRVFQWHEQVRGVLQRSLPAYEDNDQLLSLILDAAERAGDGALQASTLVEMGRLGDAETILEDWLWDVMPRPHCPVWRSLERISPMRLVDYPGLLCVRLRLTPDAAPSPAATLAVTVARKAVASTPSSVDPVLRLAALARALELACHIRQQKSVTDLARRAYGLGNDLAYEGISSFAKPAVISDVLLMAEALLVTGNITAAAGFALQATQLIEMDPRALDPSGERRAFAGRLMLLSHRQRGLDDPLDADALLSASEFIWRDADFVATHLAIAWADIDSGDLAAADSHCRTAAARLSHPERWPALVYLQAWLKLLQHRRHELRTILTSYRRFRGNGDKVNATPGYWTASQLLSRSIGEVISPPEFLLPETGREDEPFRRDLHAAQLVEALDALRAGRPAVSRACLERAISLLPRRGLSPFALLHAGADEVHELIDLIADHPEASRLQLESALQVVSETSPSAPNLSRRELEVLQLIHTGATNTEMAQELFVSVNTVKFHRTNLMRKLDARNKDEALEAAARLGILDPLPLQ